MARSAHNESHDPANGVVDALDRRVRRLEDAVAAIQDTHLMEDRVVERVVDRMEHAPYPRLHEPPGLVASATRMLMPKTVDAVPDGPPADGLAPPPAEAVHSTWLVLEVLLELRWILRMLTDYRYRMSWTGRVVLVSAIMVGILSWLLISGLPFIGGLLDRTVLILAAVVTYKAMSREVQFYQALMTRMYRYR
jgi:hypothetical protein